jgi:hypothetical protein
MSGEKAATFSSAQEEMSLKRIFYTIYAGLHQMP